MASSKPQAALRQLLHAPVYLYRWKIGRLLGHRFLLLSHIGRRTGRRHETVLEVLEYRDAVHEAVVMSGFGRNSNWLLNLQAHPDNVDVTIGSHRFRAQYRFLREDEAANVFRDYEHRNWIVAPIIRRVLSSLLGWKYSGSGPDRRRMVEQLPLVAFRPANGPLMARAES